MAAPADETAIGGLSEDDLKTIDSVRSRLFQLANSIARLKGDVLLGHPLPPPDSLQASAFVLQQNFASLNEVVAQHADLLRRIVVHPDPSFPGRTEEQVLTSLLRKKLEPDVEQAAERARATAAARGIGPASWGVGPRREEDEDDDDEDEEEEDEEEEDDDINGDGDGQGRREPLGLGDVWLDARQWCLERVGHFVMDEAADVYTQEERARGVELVRTGLRRSLEEEEDDDEDDEDEGDYDVMTDGPSTPAVTAPAGPPVEPEYLMWLAARGDTDLPRYIDIESQRVAAAATSAQKR